MEKENLKSGSVVGEVWKAATALVHHHMYPYRGGVLRFDGDIRGAGIDLELLVEDALEEPVESPLLDSIEDHPWKKN